MSDDPAPQRQRSLIGRAVGAVAPAIVRQVDVNDVVEAIDVNVIAQEIDLDALLARLDLNQVAERLDLDALVDRLDVDRIAQRLDLDALVDRLDVDRVAQRLDLLALLDRLDVDRVAARLDLDAVVDRLDVDRVARRLDMDAVVERVDVDRVAARLDMDAVVERVDVDQVAARLDMAKLTAGATTDVAVSGLDLVRRQLVRVDATVDGAIGRIIRRAPEARPDAPGALATTSAAADSGDDRPDETAERRGVSGHYAGPATRALALAGDVVAAIGLQAALGWITYLVLGLVAGIDGPSAAARWIGVSLFASAFVLYFWLPVALFGRTPAMALVGIAVVRRDGGLASARRAFVRAVFVPVSLLLPFFLLGAVLGRERRTLYDAASGTVEVYDWGAREAEQPVTIRQQLSARVRRRRSAGAG